MQDRNSIDIVKDNLQGALDKGLPQDVVSKKKKLSLVGSSIIFIVIFGVFFFPFKFVLTVTFAKSSAMLAGLCDAIFSLIIVITHKYVVDRKTYITFFAGFIIFLVSFSYIISKIFAFKLYEVAVIAALASFLYMVFHHFIWKYKRRYVYIISFLNGLLVFSPASIYVFEKMFHIASYVPAIVISTICAFLISRFESKYYKMENPQNNEKPYSPKPVHETTDQSVKGSLKTATLDNIFRLPRSIRGKISDDPDYKARLREFLESQALQAEESNNLDLALQLYQEEEEICGRINDQYALSVSLGNQALILEKRGETESAINILRKQEKICSEYDYMEILIFSIGVQASIFRSADKLNEALSLYKKEEQLCEQIGNSKEASTACYNIACLFAKQGSNAEAMEYLIKAADFGYSEPQRASEDSDLSTLRELPAFKNVIERLRVNRDARAAQ